MYDVRVWDPDYMAYEELQLNIVDADIEKSIHFSDVYTTLYVDVKLRPDMQRDLLQVELNGSPMSYDDIANLYSIKSRKKNVQCTFYYPGTFEEWIDIDSGAISLNVTFWNLDASNVYNISLSSPSTVNSISSFL